MPIFEEERINEAEAACRRLGLGALKPLQAETLAFVARRIPVFASLPTGYGKSLCSWMPAVAWGWRVWILSPLVSLIEDQAMACAELGIPVVAWSGGLSRAQRKELEARMCAGEWRIAFLSPERFLRWAENGLLEALAARGLDPDLYALDEMHCLEEWRGFRAGYRELAGPLRRQLFRGAALLGLSASFSDAHRHAWMEELCGGLRHERVSAGLGRENLSLRVIPVELEEERWLMLVSALRGLRSPESALVYCRTRAETDDVARWLRSAGIPAIAYHAGLPPSERRARSLDFRAGRLRVVCATSAFGMGIDYPHVSRVIHFSLPRDLESYWQEVGRAGRSGREAVAYAFWRRSEIAALRHQAESSREGQLALWEAWAAGDCRKAAVARRLGLAEENCGKCDRCLGEGASWGLLGPSRPAPWWVRPAARLSEWVLDRRQNRSNLDVKGSLGT